MISFSIYTIQKLLELICLRQSQTHWRLNRLYLKAIKTISNISEILLIKKKRNIRAKRLHLQPFITIEIKFCIIIRLNLNEKEMDRRGRHNKCDCFHIRKKHHLKEQQQTTSSPEITEINLFFEWILCAPAHLF